MSTTTTTFTVGVRVSHRIHGLGTVTAIQEETICGMTGEFVHVTFNGDVRMSVPLNRAGDQLTTIANENTDWRYLIEVLKEKPRKGRGRADPRIQEFQRKILSGDLVQIAEVIRDLQPREGQAVSYRGQFFDAYKRLLAQYVEEHPVSLTKAIDWLKRETGKDWPTKAEVDNAPDNPVQLRKQGRPPRPIEETPVTTQTSPTTEPSTPEREVSKKGRKPRPKPQEPSPARANNRLKIESAALKRTCDRQAETIRGLRSKLTEAEGQVTDLTGRLQQAHQATTDANESRVEASRRIQELEEQVAKLTTERDALRGELETTKTDDAPKKKKPASKPRARTSKNLLLKGMERKPDGSWWNPEWG